MIEVWLNAVGLHLLGEDRRVGGGNNLLSFDI